MKKLFTLSILMLAASTSIAGTWTYSEDVDKMTSKTTRTARLQSENSLDLAFPYKGDNYGYLMVRKHPQYGLDVMLSITKGQLLCTAYSGCKVKIRFGDKPPVNFNASPPADHDSTAIFLSNPQGFIDQASKVKSIKVQPNMSHAGSPVLEFESIDPLVWGQKVKTK
jgi:hypothetical protein